MATKKNEVAEVKEGGLPAGLDPAMLEADAAHNPKLDVGDIAIPFLAVLQDMSPQVKRHEAAYIEGAHAGMFFDNAAMEVFDGGNGLMLVPCHYERRMVEWVPRKKGGGWVGDYSPDSKVVGTATLKEDAEGNKRLTLPNGNLLVETAYQYCLYQHPDNGRWTQCVFPLTSTKLRANRQWNNMITKTVIPGTDRPAPRFLFPYHLRTKLETGDGNSWFTITAVKHEETVSAAVYQAAKDYAKICREGLVSRAIPGEDGAMKIDPETGEVLEDDKIPY